MKKCLRCAEELPDTDFFVNRHISTHTGKRTTYLSSYCRDCSKLLCAERRHTEFGLLSSIYNGQIGSSKSRGHHLPNYTKSELQDWLVSQPNYSDLYSAWENSGYLKDLKPSCDRKDDDLPYTLDNLALMTWGENSTKYKNQKVSEGVGDCKAVRQFDTEGNFIAEYHSIHEASRQTGCAAGNLLRVCKGQYKTSKGFIWRYADAN